MTAEVKKRKADEEPLEITPSPKRQKTDDNQYISQVAKWFLRDPTLGLQNFLPTSNVWDELSLADLAVIFDRRFLDVDQRTGESVVMLAMILRYSKLDQNDKSWFFNQFISHPVVLQDLLEYSIGSRTMKKRFPGVWETLQPYFATWSQDEKKKYLASINERKAGIVRRLASSYHSHIPKKEYEVMNKKQRKIAGQKVVALLIERDFPTKIFEPLKFPKN
jgi:hypothetical protein